MTSAIYQLVYMPIFRSIVQSFGRKKVTDRQTETQKDRNTESQKDRLEFYKDR